MTDEARPVDPAGPQPPRSGETAPPKKRWYRRHWLAITVGLIVLVPALGLSLWIYTALQWTYSQGERAGYIQKFSQKGWLCKTWEGELAQVNVPGAAQERWNFSVRDDSVAAAITRAMGNRVALSYNQHKGVPTSCFGETEYYVSGVRVLGP
jgi:hypothetical protein